MPIKNNFDFLRLIFSCFVIITHSYILSGLEECDFLCQITNSQLSFSYLGVRGFFVISGFLIFQSLERSRNLIEFYWKRILRLFPALIVMLLLIIILAPFVYENHALAYLKNKSMWLYFPYNLILYKEYHSIQGVFENNPYPSKINGSLWTIRYEFTMYLLLSLLFFLRRKQTSLLLILLPLFIIFTIANIFFIEQSESYKFILRANYLLDLGIYFLAGCILSVINIWKFKYKNYVLLGAVFLILISINFNFFGLIKFGILPIMVILFGLKSTPLINDIGNKMGDLSYGIYIYGFPVQQTLVYFYKLNYLQLMFYSLSISMMLAFLSWHLIEAYALKFKKAKPWIYFRPMFKNIIKY